MVRMRVSVSVSVSVIAMMMMTIMGVQLVALPLGLERRTHVCAVRHLSLQLVQRVWNVDYGRRTHRVASRLVRKLQLVATPGQAKNALHGEVAGGVVGVGSSGMCCRRGRARMQEEEEEEAAESRG